jgi:hypothetical protein
MVHSGYEASAVNETFGSVRGMLATIRAMMFNRHRRDDLDDGGGGGGGASTLRYPSSPVQVTVSARAQSQRTTEPTVA